MSITRQQLLQILPNAGQLACVFVPVLNTAMVRYQMIGPSTKNKAPSCKAASRESRALP